MKRSLLLLASCLAVCVGNTAQAKVDFQTDVAPILRQQCIDCHGPTMQLADLRLDQRKFVLVDGQERGLIKAGKSDESLLIQRLTDKKLGLIMPPSFPLFPEDKVGLAEEQIKVLKQWIDEGAVWPEGVSLAEEEQPTKEAVAAKALFVAIRAADRTSVTRLLVDRSLLKSADRYGSTPLMWATTYADVAMMQLLIESGADVNAADKSGATPLMRAAGDLAKVRLLLEHGAKVDVRSQMGRTPLLIAATYVGNSEVVRLLLKSGAKVTDRDQYGDTVLTSAAKRGDAELVEVLIEAGADLHQASSGFGDRTPLAWAAEEGNVETIACLLKHGAAKDPKSLNSALFNATVRGPKEAVQLLLEHGANATNPAGFAGYTPLMGAAYSERVDPEIVQLLLKGGADVQSKAATGDTALQLAGKRGSTEIVALLTKAGATPASARSAASPKSDKPPEVRVAAQKSIDLLQKCNLEFFRKSGCVACHQHSVTSLALAEARTRSLQIDEASARDQTQVTALTVRSYRDRFLQRADHPFNSAPAAGYILLGLAADKHAPDEGTDAIVIEMANRQTSDGSWTAFSHRPPLEYSRVTATALAVRAMQLYGPPGLKDAFEQRIARGRDWLLSARADTNSDQAFRLLGLAWSGATKEHIQAQTSTLLAGQREDGGWGQLDKLGSDAYATGLTLYALHHAGGLAATDKAYQRGVDYLLSTQLPDGSWHVASRSFPFQTYFESGFPHGPDQWISASATGFAAAALIDSLPPTAK